MSQARIFGQTFTQSLAGLFDVDQTLILDIGFKVIKLIDQSVVFTGRAGRFQLRDLLINFFDGIFNRNDTLVVLFFDYVHV
jgi:hypothetical protein